MEQTQMTPAETLTILERHFGAGKVPAKHLNLLKWWERLLADPAASKGMRRACERDLEEIVGPIAGQRVVWNMLG
ncbi:MAG: hypothetical protein WCJ30_02425 [Deltaproteobacteria bacterium]